MVACDAVIEGRFLAPPLSEPTRLTLCVRAGRVAAVERGSSSTRPDIRLPDDYVALPGFVDIHVHLRGLRLSEKEDELSGTLAAAAGGVTLVVDMPNTLPRIDNVEALSEKLSALRRNAVVDYGVYAGVPRDPREAERLASTGRIAGFKVYPEDLRDTGLVEAVLMEAWRRGLPVVVHAEHPDMVREGCRPGQRWRCRPVSAELEAIRLVSALAPRGARIHVTHASSPQLVAEAKRLGYTVDATPHHLLLSSEDEAEKGCVAKVNPPLRPPEARDRLLQLLASGEIDAIATDHAPHRVEEKLGGFDDCPPGIPSIEHYARLMLTLVARGVITLGDLVRLCSLNPARVIGLGLYGCIEPGCIASYTVVDLRREGRIVGYEGFSKAKLTPFEGWQYRGEPVATIVRGRLVYHEGCICARPGWGENLAALRDQGGRPTPR